MIRLAAMTTTTSRGSAAPATGSRGAGACGSDVPARHAHPPGADDAGRARRAPAAVVDHHGGPLLVLAGPGTGKTTTLVEAIVGRIERGAGPTGCSR